MAANASPSGKLSHIILFVGMAVVLSLPALSGMFHCGPSYDLQEMRALAPWPDWPATGLRNWPTAFEHWVNDHFPLRSVLVRSHGTIQHRLLNDSTDLVVVGRDHWLFYVGDKTISDLLGHDRFTDEELAAWSRALEGRAAWWREHGARYLFVIVPNKTTIYPEMLPSFYQRHARPGKLQQLVDYFEAHHCPVPVIDLRGALIPQKPNQTLYWPTDSHWNAHGLVIASDAIMRKLQALGAPSGPRDELQWIQIEEAKREGDCVGLLRMRGRWPVAAAPQLQLAAPANIRIVPTSVAQLPLLRNLVQPVAFERDTGIGTAVIFCDSFFRVGGLAPSANAQAPLLLNFHRFVSIWPWYGPQNFATYETIAAVQQLEQPTVVVEQWTERYLRTPPPDHPEFEAARDRAIASEIRRN